MACECPPLHKSQTNVQACVPLPQSTGRRIYVGVCVVYFVLCGLFALACAVLIDGLTGCRLFCCSVSWAAAAERVSRSRVGPQLEGSRSGEAVGVCGRSATWHPTMFCMPRSRRLQAWSPCFARTACRLYRTATRGLCAGHPPERYLRADASDRETTDAR